MYSSQSFKRWDSNKIGCLSQMFHSDQIFKWFSNLAILIFQQDLTVNSFRQKTYVHKLTPVPFYSSHKIFGDYNFFHKSLGQFNLETIFPTFLWFLHTRQQKATKSWFKHWVGMSEPSPRFDQGFILETQTSHAIINGDGHWTLHFTYLQKHFF